MSRRSFLAAILAASAAPAYVRAGSLMPIFVPRTDIIVPEMGNIIRWLDVRDVWATAGPLYIKPLPPGEVRVVTQ